MSLASTALTAAGLHGIEDFVNDIAKAQSGLRDLETFVPDQVAQRIARDAATMARGLGSVAAKSADSIRFAPTGQVHYGGQPWNMGAEFGSYRYHQFQPWRGNSTDAGYFFYPTIRQAEADFEQLTLDEVDEKVVKPLADD